MRRRLWIVLLTTLVVSPAHADATETILALHSVVDRDDSEFVSDEEAGYFCKLIEFGYFADQLLQEGRLDLQALGTAAGLSPEQVEARMVAYRTVRASLSEQGLSPDLPGTGLPRAEF